MGNSAADMPCLEYDTVKAVSGSTIKLSALPFPCYIGYEVVFASGSLNGRTRSIVGQSGNVFALDAAPTGVAVGDKVVIGATFKRNVVSHNTVTASSNRWPAINLYGMCYQNMIENNHVRIGAIKVESTDNLRRCLRQRHQDLRPRTLWLQHRQKQRRRGCRSAPVLRLADVTERPHQRLRGF